MIMSEADICLEYKLARLQSEQIQILADLNLCDTESIMRVLIRNGVDMSNAVYHRNKRARANLVKVVMEELEAADQEVRKAIDRYEKVMKSIDSIGGKRNDVHK